MTLSRRQMLVCGAAAALGVGALSLPYIRPPAADGSGVMTPPEALTAAAEGAILLVDIRRPDEWARTGVPLHAVPIDMRRDDFLAQLSQARTSETQPVALICARGVRSARLTQRLDAAGVAPIVDIPEGMLGSTAGPGWLKRGLPVV